MKDAEFKELLKSVREAGQIKREHKSPSRQFNYGPIDVKRVRKKLGLSQSQFSSLIQVSLRTLQNWEQGRRQPQGPALALLRILKKDPKHAINALH